MTDRRKLLITGAAGYIGTFLRKAWGDDYELVLTDCKDIVNPGSAQVVIGDIRDLDLMKNACDGVDTVVHLAADASMEAHFDETVLPINIVGTHSIYSAAVEAGVKRVIFASSIHAVGAYPPDVQVKWDMPVRPCCEYGASKCYGEALGSYFADKRGLTVIAVRIGGVHGHKNSGICHAAKSVDYGISEADLTQLMTKCLETPMDLPYTVFHGISNNRFKRLDISHAREVLGYEPVDDSGETVKDYTIPEPQPLHAEAGKR